LATLRAGGGVAAVVARPSIVIVPARALALLALPPRALLLPLRRGRSHWHCCFHHTRIVAIVVAPRAFALLLPPRALLLALPPRAFRIGVRAAAAALPPRALALALLFRRGHCCDWRAG